MRLPPRMTNRSMLFLSVAWRAISKAGAALLIAPDRASSCRQTVLASAVMLWVFGVL
jgi:hypothetical protein